VADARPRSVDDVVQQYGPDARAHLRPLFAQAGVAYPPKSVRLLALKEERRLELWAASEGEPRFIKEYAIQAASGGPGPKRSQGDLQVPEGVYPILWLNPNSGYHLSMKVGYPNEFDRAKAQADKRTELGGDIFIHGKAVSIGCIALGDPAIEELFVLVADSGVSNVRAVITPHDLRRRPVPATPQPDPAWLPELYATLALEIKQFARP
jgi:murein L,D-transpeptidase YafK